MKTALIILGTIAFLMGLMDSLAGALIPHGRGLIIWGIIGLAIAGVLHLRKKWQQRHTFPLLVLAIVFFGAADVCAETIHAVTLTPPDATPIIQRHLGITGADIWLAILVIIVAIGAAAWIFRKRLFPSHRPHCRGMGGPQKARGRL